MIFYQKQLVSVEAIRHSKIDLRAMVKNKMQRLLMADVGRYIAKYPQGIGFVVRTLHEFGPEDSTEIFIKQELHTVKALVLLESYEYANVDDLVSATLFTQPHLNDIYINVARVKTGVMFIEEQKYERFVIHDFKTYCYKRVK